MRSMGIAEEKQPPSTTLASIASSSTDSDTADRVKDLGGETPWTFFKQSCGPFLIAGIGLISAGLFLDRAQFWSFLQKVPQTVVLVPALLGLKGNLEMTYASRISTLANKGQLSSKEEVLRALLTNLCLIEAQAVALSFFVAVISIMLSSFNRKFIFQHALLMASSSVATGTISSVILGNMMIAVVVMSHRCGINPDNITSPIAASVGDLVTLVLLVGTGTLMQYFCSENLNVICGLVLTYLLLAVPFLLYAAAKSEDAKEVLVFGWWALITAVIIGSFGGLILHKAISIYPGMAAFHPLITGLGGNRVAVQSSRRCTALHLSGYPLGTLPDGNSIWTYCNPLRTFFSAELDSNIALVLAITGVPFYIAFVIVIFAISKNAAFSYKFLGAYIFISLIQAFTLLYICEVVVHVLWKFGVDPDHSAVPLLTAIGDLLGTALLFSLFITLDFSSTFPRTDV